MLNPLPKYWINLPLFVGIAPLQPFAGTQPCVKIKLCCWGVLLPVAVGQLNMMQEVEFE